MNYFVQVSVMIAGLALGAFVVWFLLRARTAGAIAVLNERVTARDFQIENLKKNLTQAQDESKRLASRLEAECTARASAEEKAHRIPQLETQVASWQTASGAQNEQNVRLAEQVSSLEEKLTLERQQIEAL